MLGRTATGLASLLGSELGIAVDKKLQHHDWTERPIQSHHLRYLADDVVYLEALADKLWNEVEAPRGTDGRGIGDAPQTVDGLDLPELGGGGPRHQQGDTEQ